MKENISKNGNCDSHIPKEVNIWWFSVITQDWVLTCVLCLRCLWYCSECAMRVDPRHMPPAFLQPMHSSWHSVCALCQHLRDWLAALLHWWLAGLELASTESNISLWDSEVSTWKDEGQGELGMEQASLCCGALLQLLKFSARKESFSCPCSVLKVCHWSMEPIHVGLGRRLQRYPALPAWYLEGSVWASKSMKKGESSLGIWMGGRRCERGRYISLDRLLAGLSLLAMYCQCMVTLLVSLSWCIPWKILFVGLLWLQWCVDRSPSGAGHLTK